MIAQPLRMAVRVGHNEDYMGLSQNDEEYAKEQNLVKSL